MRVIFYAVNGLGIGHLTRLLAIARRLRRRAADAEILFLTSSEADHLIYQEGFPAIKFPSKTIRAEVGLKKRTFLETCMPVAWNVISSFRPDVIVVDTFPQGSLQELIPVLHWSPKMVFVFREQKLERVADPEFQQLLRYYDHILVPHAEGEFDPQCVGIPLTFTGPILIRDREELLVRREVRRQLELPDNRRIVYCTFGGGGDEHARRVFQWVHHTLSARKDCFLVTANGPLSRGLTAMSQDNAQLFYFPAMELFPAFDVAISAAGYNTCNELLYAGVPSIFIPFERDLDDQTLRADRIEKAGAGVRLDTLTEKALNYAFDRLLAEAPTLSEKARAWIPANGAGEAARVIAELAGLAVEVGTPPGTSLC
ncbi:MAG: UDP-glucosyltransferase [Acidobacteria bacterium]|nr:UDP-glucosyltransferase [Acidobacteriota bacterium]MBI3654925.1 UDP-glucosyltransferase [Acidobacteriota bacterium]